MSIMREWSWKIAKYTFVTIAYFAIPSQVEKDRLFNKETKTDYVGTLAKSLHVRK